MLADTFHPLPDEAYLDEEIKVVMVIIAINPTPTLSEARISELFDCIIKLSLVLDLAQAIILKQTLPDIRHMEGCI